MTMYDTVTRLYYIKLLLTMVEIQQSLGILSEAQRRRMVKQAQSEIRSLSRDFLRDARAEKENT